MSQPKFHPRYTYRLPEQVILVSNNQLHFAVFKEGLIHSSPVFADAFSLPQPPHDDSVAGSTNNALDPAIKHAIQLDANDLVTESFIIVLNTSIPICPATELEDMVSLLDLCVKYQVGENTISLIKSRMQIIFDKSPWKWLAVASKYDDRDMGASALEKMGREGFFRGDKLTRNETTSTFWARMSTLSPNWVVPILSTTMVCPSDVEYGRYVYADFDEWSSRTQQAAKNIDTKSNRYKILSYLTWKTSCEKFRDGLM